MSKLTNKKWWMETAERAVKTVCQAALAMIPTAVFITAGDWKTVIGTAALAGVVSVITSIATLKSKESE